MAAKPRRRRRPPRVINYVKINVLPDGRVDRNNAAKYLGKSPQTLAIWGVMGKGPSPHSVGGRGYYYLSEVEAYVAAEVAGTGSR
jgi:hypothetical protein